MAKILSNDELIKALEADYSSRATNKTSIEMRKWNIDAFNGLDRNNLEYGKREKRMLLYETIENESIYIQFPGKESVEKTKMPLDFRPKVKLKSGDYAIDLSFGAIWDILDDISKHYKAYLKYVAALFFRLGYMHDYKKIKSQYLCEGLKINSSDIEVCTCENVDFEWYCLDLNEDVWYTLNDRIGWIDLGNGQQISFEGLIKLVDLLFQNEDCKYFYKNVYIKKKVDYKYGNGRNNSSAANLLILNYLEGNVRLSKLLDAFQQGKGVPRFKKSDYSVVTDNIVINIEHESR